MSENLPAEPQHSPAPPKSRRKLRLAAVGGIAAVAILGGGITAVASASTPSTADVAAAVTTSAPTTSGGTTAPKTGTPAEKPPAQRGPHLAGTVTSVSGTTVLIKDRDGFTRTIVLSSKTTYSDGLTAELAVGAKIHASGTVAANGTSLDATSVGVDNGPMGGPGGPGRRPGGPRGGHGPGDGDRPAPGTGTPPATGTSGAAPSTSSAAPTTS